MKPADDVARTASDYDTPADSVIAGRVQPPPADQVVDWVGEVALARRDVGQGKPAQALVSSRATSSGAIFGRRESDWFDG